MKVFGSEARLGDHAKQHTVRGTMLDDPELVLWRKSVSAWNDTYERLERISWEKLHRPQFPIFDRLQVIQREGDLAYCASSSPPAEIARVKRKQQAGKAAGRWIFVLDRVMPDVYLKRLQHGDAFQRQTYKEYLALEKWKGLVQKGKERARVILARLELLTLYRILTKTKALLCTVDSTERMIREMTGGLIAATKALGIDPGAALATFSLDTAILDEAACVLETAVPVILSLGVKNLTLVGDQRQLQPFSMVRDSFTTKHTRSFMERALDVGYQSHFLDVQYRMHPSICQVVSSIFYGGRLKTAPQTAALRRSTKPLKWVHVSGGEKQHPQKGYSNRSEARVVAEQTRMAMQRYGASAEIVVITFYNMQKLELKEEWEKHPGLKHVRIASVDACQGSDADVVIISTVRSGRPGRRLSGFVLDKRRINVALSRAREECIVVGDKRMFRDEGGASWRFVVDSFSS